MKKKDTIIYEISICIIYGYELFNIRMYEDKRCFIKLFDLLT